MLILAIDTALDACSVVVFDAARDVVVARESAPMARGHAEALMPMIARVMTAARLNFSAIDRFAVTTGPGSFTGMRVGIAAARGLGLASGKPVVGLSTLAAFAAPYIAEDPTLPVLVAIDARHDHVYLEIFGTAGHTLVSPRVVSIAEALRLSAGGTPRIVGTAANVLAAAWSPGGKQPVSVEPRMAPDIDWLARLGGAANVAGSPAKPLYIRPPDAQPQTAAKLARQ